MVHLLYFAWVREMVGTDSPGHAAALADRSRIRIAVDQAFATAATPLNNPREIAIFPPVTGG
jgi:molybdopterin synthase sulfur carrier subunit